jgi:hypothetical protein
MFLTPELENVPIIRELSAEADYSLFNVVFADIVLLKYIKI